MGTRGEDKIFKLCKVNTMNPNYLLWINIFFTTLLFSSSVCLSDQYPEQGTDRCIAGSPQTPPGIWLPKDTCSLGHHVIQGTLTCEEKQEGSFTGPFLPECTNGRLEQGTSTCDTRYPKANAGADITTHIGKTITIIGSGTDTDGMIVSYDWKNGSILLSDSASFDYTPIQEGQETLTLTVMDDDSLKASDTMVVTAVPNEPPVADAGSNQIVIVSTVTNLNGSGSYDPDGNSNLLDFNWTMTQKPPGSMASLSDRNIVNPTFTADMEGNYTVALIVNDGRDNSQVSDVNITTTKNIALHKFVDALTNTVHGSPQDITDGNLSNIWYCYKYPSDWTQSFILDLKSTYSIEEYKFQTSQVNDLVIESSLDGVNWTKQHELFGLVDPNPPQDIIVAPAYQARYLRYTGTRTVSSGWVGMMEFEVDGTLVP